jgi:hypothetical protein
MLENGKAGAEIASLMEEYTEKVCAAQERTVIEAMRDGLTAVLDGAARPRAARGAKKARRAKPGRRAPRKLSPGRVVPVAKLTAYVAKHPGQRGEQIAAALGTTSAAIRGPMKTLIKSKSVKTKGQRRGMTYFPV